MSYRTNETASYRAQRAKCIAHGKKHDERMAEIANRAGLTLAQLRAKPTLIKESLIAQYRKPKNQRT